MGARTNFFTNLIYSSEMACSLMFEDARGCRYNVFTKPYIALLSSSCTALAIAALLIGS